MKTIKVLFVGNSYTFYNQMPQELFSSLAEKAGYEVELTQITKGGYRLSQFADANDKEGARLREAIDGVRFDYAVLQEQSLTPITDERGFLDGVFELASLIAADQFVLYATWGRNDSSPDLKELGLSCEAMTEKLGAAYRKAARRINARVAQVGEAFWEYAKTHDRNELYNADGSHPSEVGSAIAAQVILDAMRP